MKTLSYVRPDPAAESNLPEGAGSARILHRTADKLLGGLILFALVTGPWAFGTTQPWSINLMTGVGMAAWGLLAVKWWLGRLENRGTRSDGDNAEVDPEVIFNRWMGGLTMLILGYCLISAANARATYHPESLTFDYHASLWWLPHSYDSASSWEMFWIYLGVAGLFWGTRSWVMSGPGAKEAAARQRRKGHSTKHISLLPSRIRVLLWVLTLNGTLLALEAIFQRLSGSTRLLWLIEPRINKDVLSQFGPYAYRANAAQYFNLIWPVTLGLWWTYWRARESIWPVAGGEDKRYHVLLSCALVMAVSPVVSTSRGGAIIMGASVCLSALVLFMANWHSTWAAKLAVFGLFGAMVGGGVLLGWQELGPRLEIIQSGIEGREALFLTGQRMADAEPVFGLGPGTFSRLFPLFRTGEITFWPAQQHNDWLETVITFGWLGLGLVVLAVALVVGRWFFRGRCYGEKHFVMLMWIALGGCLVHASYDFPFQIHSILTLFVLLCAALSCLSRDT